MWGSSLKRTIAVCRFSVNYFKDNYNNLKTECVQITKSSVVRGMGAHLTRTMNGSAPGWCSTRTTRQKCGPKTWRHNNQQNLLYFLSIVGVHNTRLSYVRYVKQGNKKVYKWNNWWYYICPPMSVSLIVRHLKS